MGGIAEPHLEAYAGLDCVRVVGVAEPRTTRRLEIAARYGVAAFESGAALLEATHPDIVCILTPASSHREVTEMCAAAGAHILCEKPMAHTLEDALAMHRSCVSHGVQFCYGSSYRHLPAVREARRIIAAGEIGKVRLMVEQVLTGRGEAEYRPLSEAHYPIGGPGGGGYGLVDHGIHMLDVMPWLCGSAVTAALGRGDRSGDCARPEFAMLTLQSGALGVLVYDGSTWPLELPAEGLFSEGRDWVDQRGWVGPRGQWDAHPGSIRVYGSTGSLRICHYVNRLFINRREGLHQLELPHEATPAHFGVQMRHFCAELDVGTVPSCGAVTGIQTLATLFAIYASERSGGWQSLSPTDFPG